MTGNEEAGFGVEPESRPTRSTKPCEPHSTALLDSTARLVTPETEVLLAFDVDAALRAACEATARLSPSDLERRAAALGTAREAAARFLRGLWTRALRGPVVEPHAADGWDSGLRVAVARSFADRLLGWGVPADVVALLLAGWGATYTEPPLEEDVVLGLVRRLAPNLEEAA